MWRLPRVVRVGIVLVHSSHVVGVGDFDAGRGRNNVDLPNIVLASVITEGIQEGGEQGAQDGVLDVKADRLGLVLYPHALEHAHYHQDYGIAVQMVASRSSELQLVQEGPHYEEQGLE